MTWNPLENLKSRRSWSEALRKTSPQWNGQRESIIDQKGHGWMNSVLAHLDGYQLVRGDRQIKLLHLQSVQERCCRSFVSGANWFSWFPSLRHSSLRCHCCLSPGTTLFVIDCRISQLPDYISRVLILNTTIIALSCIFSYFIYPSFTTLSPLLSESCWRKVKVLVLHQF